MALPPGLPEDHGYQTLGWDLLDWASTYLAQPDGIHKGATWTYTDDQARFILWFYSLHPDSKFDYEAGKFAVGGWLFRRAYRERAKGVGKTPMVAAIASTELLGPVQFDGFDAYGRPVGRPHPNPLVQLAAVSESQADQTMVLINSMLANGAAESEYGLDIALSRIYVPNSGKLEKVTASPRSREGARPTFVVLEEALALDTPIPTPTGWITMGDIEVGDIVLSGEGTPTAVTKTTDVFEDRDCYRVIFPDRTEVVASGGHLWWAKPNGCQPRVMTTEEMFRSPTRVLIPRSPVVEYEEKDLSLDPYILGYWLGDGNSHNGQITVSAEDLPHLLAQGDFGKVTEYPDRPGNFRVCALGAKPKLRDLGVLQDKHIPLEYLRSSVAQRTALLQGLMDSDGSANKTQGTYAGKNQRLVNGVAELTRSLGYRTTVTQNLQNGDPFHWVYIQGSAELFRLPRKRAKIKCTQKPKWQTVKVEQTESVPVRCIAVDNPNRLFLAGKSYKVTHNTHNWVPAERGPEFAEVLRRNLGKLDGRSIEVTNAPLPGENSVAEASHREYSRLESAGGIGGVLFDSESIHVDDVKDPEQAIPALKWIYRNSPWVNVNRIFEEICDSNTRESSARKFYFNEIVIGESGWLKEKEVKACRNPKLKPLKKTDRIALGFKGGMRNGAAAVVAVRLRDQAVFLLRMWEKPEHADRTWEVPYYEVDQFMRKQFEKRDVFFAYADPHQYQDIVGKWAADYDDVIEEFWLTSRAKYAKAIEGFESAVRAERVVWNDQPDLERHIGNCHIDETPQGDILRKETLDSKRYIAAAQAAVLALEACKEAIERGGLAPEVDRTMRAW